MPAPSEGSTIAKFAVPIIIGIIVSVGLTWWGRSLDSSSDQDKAMATKLDALSMTVSKLATDVAVIKAVVVDSGLAGRVAKLETDVSLIKEKLPK
jgi:hypothetical protein